eukprot:6049288-Amphidinium_carterae.1
MQKGSPVARRFVWEWTDGGDCQGCPCSQQRDEALATVWKDYWTASEQLGFRAPSGVALQLEWAVGEGKNARKTARRALQWLRSRRS